MGFSDDSISLFICTPRVPGRPAVAALVFSLVGSPTAAFSMTVSFLAAPAVEVFWATVIEGSAVAAAMGVLRASPELSPVVTAWTGAGAGAGAGALALPVTNSFKPVQFLLGGLVAEEPWDDGALEDIAAAGPPGVVGVLGTC